jgi:PAS domain S-box-containing protein
MLTSTANKVRLVVSAGVIAVLVVGAVALVATERAVAMSPDPTDLRFVQGLLGLLLLLAVVLAWFAYASLQADLAERERAADAVRASEAKFAGILEIAADAIISVGEDQRIIHFNRGAERIFDWPAAEVLGKPLDILLPERHVANHAAHVRGFGRAPETSRQMADRREIFGRRRDGSEFPAEASISKLVQPSGDRIYTVSMRDISERRQREEAQRRFSEAVDELGQTLEVEATERSIVQLPVPWLGDGAILSTVTGTEVLRRRPSRTGDGRLDSALAVATMDPLDLDSPSRVVDVLRTGRMELIEDVDDEWIEAHTANEDEFQRMRAIGMRTALFVPLVAREHVLGVLNVFRVTARPFTAADRQVAEGLALRAAFALDNARLYQTARLATSARDHALGVVSHDLRNPISAAGMCARALLAAMPADDEERRGLAQTIVESTELTQRMIRDLLDVSSIEVGRLSVERRAESLAPMLQRAADLFEHEAAMRGVALAVEAVEEPLTVQGDAERLVQALANLLANALKHTPGGGRIAVRARRTAHEAEVEVQDTGSGIAPEAMPLIFERYWTVKGNAPKGGTGLGLAIARGIVEAHGGRLSAESVVGEGSTFRFTLPLALG